VLALRRKRLTLSLKSIFFYRSRGMKDEVNEGKGDHSNMLMLRNWEGQLSLEEEKKLFRKGQDYHREEISGQPIPERKRSRSSVKNEEAAFFSSKDRRRSSLKGKAKPLYQERYRGAKAQG